MHERLPLIKYRNSTWRHYYILAIVCGCLGLIGLATTINYQPKTKTHLDFSGDLIQRCTVHRIVQSLDHFQAYPGEFEQRYFICNEFWKSTTDPIFFYAGNEANVELYLNHTGLMWESAHEFNALLIFAEHRYFGESMPKQKPNISLGEYAVHLSSQQALADFAVLINHIKKVLKAPLSPVVAFGGSYGGMLAAWMRLKYPHLIHGTIAASAPMLSFLGFHPPMNLAEFSRIVTYDASEAAGAAPNCALNIRQAWSHLFAFGASNDTAHQLDNIFNICPGRSLTSHDRLKQFANWAKDAYENMAMGNYPYPTSYITGGDRVLPAFPMRAACEPMGKKLESPEDYLRALKASIDVYYNTSGTLSCHSFKADEAVDYWNYLNCADMYTPTDQTGVDDMFWMEMHNISADNEVCKQTWGVSVRPFWPS
ncbi:lysosomal Pro-X carboxypeptidase, partial [Thraustotheca clavata]